VLKKKAGDEEVWQCKIYRTYGSKACSSPQIRSCELDEILSQIFTELAKDKQAIIDSLVTVLVNVPKDVDSDLWDIKSWAALKYYQSADFGINSFYVVGDGTTDAIPYDEVNQGNKAHFVEIVAVSAINHFVQTPTNVLQRWNMFSTQWNQNFRGNLDYNMWGVELREEIACLARFYAFGKFFNMMREDKFYPVNRLFYQKINGDESYNARLKDLESLIFSNDNANDSFMKWIVE
jgi:hypothetical protein